MIWADPFPSISRTKHPGSKKGRPMMIAPCTLFFRFLSYVNSGGCRSIRVGPPFQCRAIVVRTVGISLPLSLPLFGRLFGLRAQRGFAWTVVNLAGKHHVPQPRFHGIEFRCGDDVLVLLRQYPCNLFLRIRNSFRSWRVRREYLRYRSRPALLIRLNSLKEGHIRVRVVSSLIHVLNAE